MSKSIPSKKYTSTKVHLCRSAHKQKYTPTKVCICRGVSNKEEQAEQVIDAFVDSTLPERIKTKKQHLE